MKSNQKSHDSIQGILCLNLTLLSITRAIISPCRPHDSLEAVAVVPEVVLGVDALDVDLGVLPAQDDLVPEHYLVQRVLGRLVLGHQVEEQLLGVPVEDRGEVGLQVERQEAQVVLLARGAVVSHVLAAMEMRS